MDDRINFATHGRKKATYKSIQKDMQRLIRESKQKELDVICHDIKVLQSGFDEFNMHKKKIKNSK